MHVYVVLYLKFCSSRFVILSSLLSHFRFKYMSELCEMPQYSIRLEAVRYLCRSCLLPAFHDAYCHVPATK